MLTSTTPRAARVSDGPSQSPDGRPQSSALAWLQVEGTSTRVVALTVASPDSNVPVALRFEEFQGQTVLVEHLRISCEDDGLHWPRRPAFAGVDVPFPPNPDCPRLVEIERVWQRHGETFNELGAYAIAGEQQVSPDLERHFSSSAVFEADGLTVTDQSEWMWLGARRRDQLWEDDYRPVVAAASSSFQRRYRLVRGALVELSGVESTPKGTAVYDRKVPAEINVGVPCAL